MIHPSFGEDFIRILAHGSKMRSTEFEVTAYSDGVTRWRIHLDPGSPLVSGGPSDQEAFSGVELQRNLYGAAWLGTEWTRSAIPDYQGALSYEVEVHNLKGKNLRTGPDGNARATLGFDVAPWKGASTFTHPTNFLDRSEEHTSELQSHSDLVCRLLLEKKKRR